MFAKRTYSYLLVLLLGFFSFSHFCFAKKKKFEKAVWIMTVYGLDWPKAQDADSQKKELIEMLDKLKEHGFNRVYFQVRGRGDALYESNNFPWSSFLTGELGKDPGYDPLEFAVEECKKRGIICEAALVNPFLINSEKGLFDIDDYMDKLPENSKMKDHKDWIMSTDENYYLLNPGVPEVREMMAEECEYIAGKYGVGVHLNDFYYPYPDKVKNEGYDNEAYENYKKSLLSEDNEVDDEDDKEGEDANEEMSIEDWRRDNVNKFVKSVSSKVRSKGQTLSASFFGVWKSSREDKTLSSYYDLYIDSKKWLKNEWLDYIIPQVALNFGQNTSGFLQLTRWWEDQAESKKTKLLIGLSIYASFADGMKERIEFLKKLNNVRGFAVFRFESLNEIFEKRIM